MRTLFVCIGELGHVHPLLPLAHALADAGNEVRFASGGAVTDRIERAGFGCDAIRPSGTDEMFAAFVERVGPDPGAGLAPDAVMDWFMPNLFAETVAPMMLPDLLAVAERSQPDVIVYDTSAFAAPLVAELIGVPSVQHAFGLLFEPSLYRRVGAALAPLWRDHGRDPDPMGGLFRGLCFSIAPPSLEVPLDAAAAPQVRPLRPVGFSATTDDQLPGWVANLPDRPTVYVTLGTFLNSDQSVFRAALDGLAEEPVNVIVTVGRNHPVDWLDPVPANARVEQYIAQSLLLSACDVVVSHAGSGTLLPALGAGLPQVLLPQGADNFVNTRRAQAAGVGPALWPGHVTPDALRDAVRASLDDPTYRRAAQRLGREIAAMPAPRDVIRDIEATTSA